MLLTWVLTVFSLRISSSAISLFDLALGDQPQHVKLALGEIMLRRGGHGRRELVHQLARDLRVQLRLAAVDGADRLDQFRRQHVLHQIAVRARLDRGEDLFIFGEGCQHQTLLDGTADVMARVASTPS